MAKEPHSHTLAELLAEGTELLRAAGIESPRREASLLVRELLGIDTARLIAHPETSVPAEKATELRNTFARRAAGEPLQYIIGRQEFYGLDFEVTPAVLIPRPETELLVETVLDACRGIDAPRVIDVGTGSGCIPVAVAVNVPSARVTTIDISPDATAVARRNAERHGVTGRIVFLHGDFFHTVGADAEWLDLAPAHVVVSNPPYIAEHELAGLQREVRDFEPVTALVGGPEGTESYARLLAQAGRFLLPEGTLAFEVGFGQAERVAAMGEAAGWRTVGVRDDLQGIPRVVVFLKM